MELICYVAPGWRPRIRVAEPSRPWMDDTPESYAYRCLPLSIANSHGWEILSPCTFAVRWHGAAEASSLEIDLSEAGSAEFVPQSLFGSGVLTIHVEGVLRTSPGWNLWVSGPPNTFKDGIAPLAGVIETDWSPYTFTINWKVTRPGEWIRFEENEPVCFFFPIPRAACEQFEPRIAPMSENAELEAEFNDWARARLEFHQKMHREAPEIPSDRWQKLYYRGVLPDGKRAIEDHEIKLRICPFTGRGGS